MTNQYEWIILKVICLTSLWYHTLNPKPLPTLNSADREPVCLCKRSKRICLIEPFNQEWFATPSFATYLNVCLQPNWTVGRMMTPTWTTTTVPNRAVATMYALAYRFFFKVSPDSGALYTIYCNGKCFLYQKTVLATCRVFFCNGGLYDISPISCWFNFIQANNKLLTGQRTIKEIIIPFINFPVSWAIVFKF